MNRAKQKATKNSGLKFFEPTRKHFKYFLVEICVIRNGKDGQLEPALLSNPSFDEKEDNHPSDVHEESHPNFPYEECNQHAESYVSVGENQPTKPRRQGFSLCR